MRYFEMPIIDVNEDGSLHRCKHCDPGIGILGHKQDNSKGIGTVTDSGDLTDMLIADEDVDEVNVGDLPEFDEAGEYP